MTAPAATIAISVLGLLWLGIAAFLAYCSGLTMVLDLPGDGG